MDVLIRTYQITGHTYSAMQFRLSSITRACVASTLGAQTALLGSLYLLDDLQWYTKIYTIIHTKIK